MFSTEILKWYAKNGRDLPWRKSPTLYQVLVSEIMLQQTQVSRVIEKYHEFLKTFPALQDLAKANKAEVIQAWSGLGYNRRALLLHKFAQEVCHKYDGIIPDLPEALRKLPGIGPYTAGSISAFAFNRPEPAVDVNVRRIFMRYFHGLDQGLPMAKIEEKKLYQLVKDNIPDGKSSDFHNALMDFGSLLCGRDKPSCSVCPLQKTCKFAPLYDEQKSNVLFVMEKKQEKGVTEKGKYIPNRIFRGRVVEWVRRNENKLIATEELGTAVKHDYTTNDEDWLFSLLEKLQQEGFIKYMQEEEMLRISLG